MINIDQKITKIYGKYPERVLQIGEGNFLRAFADWMIETANEKGVYKGSILMTSAKGAGKCAVVNKQNGLYTVVTRGIENGKLISETKPITSVSRCVDITTDYKIFIEAAANPDLQVVISNTTEAGIAFKEDDKATDTPPSSFPAKITAFLYARFKAFNGDNTKGLLFLPTELIDHNGDMLKKYILAYAISWNLGKDFEDWIENANKFTNTMVDRIVTGYPKEAQQVQDIEAELGYKDELLVCCEVFNMWIIEGKKEWAEIFPLHKANKNVIWTDDVTPYKKRKVGILNGAHTGTVPAAYLAGHNIVLDFMGDPLFTKYLDVLLFQEVIPTLDLPKEELEQFAAAVKDRFANPYIKHALLDISLNCCSKFNARCLPSLLEYKKRKGTLPKVLTFAFAAFIHFYNGKMENGVFTATRNDGTKYPVRDLPEVIEFFDKLYSAKPSAQELAKAVLAQASFWGGQDLTQVENLQDAVAAHLQEMQTKPMADLIKKLVA